MIANTNCCRQGLADSILAEREAEREKIQHRDEYGNSKDDHNKHRRENSRKLKQRKGRRRSPSYSPSPPLKLRPRRPKASDFIDEREPSPLPPSQSRITREASCDSYDDRRGRSSHPRPSVSPQRRPARRGSDYSYSDRSGNFSSSPGRTRSAISAGHRSYSPSSRYRRTSQSDRSRSPDPCDSCRLSRDRSISAGHRGSRMLSGSRSTSPDAHSRSPSSRIPPSRYSYQSPHRFSQSPSQKKSRIPPTSEQEDAVDWGDDDHEDDSGPSSLSEKKLACSPQHYQHRRSRPRSRSRSPAEPQARRYRSRGRNRDSYRDVQRSLGRLDDDGAGRRRAGGRGYRGRSPPPSQEPSASHERCLSPLPKRRLMTQALRRKGAREYGRREIPPLPREPSPRRERSLSPFSKRRLMTQGMTR